MCTTLCATAATVDRVDPPNWWVGFENPNVELLVHGDGVGHLQPHLVHKGIRISGYHMREAGATAVQEVGFTLANALDVIEEQTQDSQADQESA